MQPNSFKEAERTPELRRTGLYLCSQSLNTEPVRFIPTKDALRLLRSGAARSVNHKTGIQILHQTQGRLRDQSCLLGERIIEEVALGSSYHACLVEAWPEGSKFRRKETTDGDNDTEPGPAAA